MFSNTTTVCQIQTINMISCTFARFDSLLSLGKKLLPSCPSSPEVKERMKQLSQERAAVKEAWENRNKLLKQCTDLQVIMLCNVLDNFVAESFIFTI